MPRSIDRPALGRLGLLSILATSLGALGCPGTLDPSLLTSGTGGSGATGGTGGTTGTGGTGGIACDYMGILMGATTQGPQIGCAIGGCHDALTALAGLNLTPDANVGSRLVGVMSTGMGSSLCGAATEPYLKPGMNPAAGLLIDKITLTTTSKPPLPCGGVMPQVGALLSTAQQACIEQWAEGLVTAAGGL